MPQQAPLSVVTDQPQLGVEKFFDRTYSNLTDRIEFEVPRNNPLSKVFLKVTARLNSSGGTPVAGDVKNVHGEAVLVKKITLKGNGDDEQIAAPGYLVRHRSYERVGEFPKQTGLPANLTAGHLSNVDITCIIPLDFIRPRSTSPHATDADPRLLGQYICIVDLMTAAGEFFPDFDGTITVSNIRVKAYSEQVLNAVAGVHAAYETKLVRTGDIVLTASDPNNIYDAPRGLTLLSWYFMALVQYLTTAYYEPNNSVISNWEFKVGLTSLRKWDETDRRDIYEQFLTQQTGSAVRETVPTGWLAMDSSEFDLELQQGIKLVDNSRARMIFDLVKAATGTKVEAYYETAKQVFFLPEKAA